MRNHRTFRRGYLLIELLCTFALLGVFALISTRLFNSVFKVMWQNSQATEVPMRFDSAVNILRSDMAASVSFDMPDAMSIVVHQSREKVILWRCDGTQVLSRKDGEVQRNWEIGQAIEFKKEGSIVLIHAKDSVDSLADIAIAPGGKQ